MSKGLLLLIILDDVSVGFFWVIVIPTLLALLVGAPLYLWSQKRAEKQAEQARDSMFDMPLADLQGQNVSLALEQRAFRDLLLSPVAVEWMELLVRRTFQGPNLPDNYAFLVEKYISILKQLVQRLQPWSDAWIAKGSEPVGEVRLQATDAQWLSHIAGFPETVAWLAKVAAEQSRLAARVKDFAVPQWDESFYAFCESNLNGFLRSWTLTTQLHGASLADEINRISQPVTAHGELNDFQVAPEDGAKGDPTDHRKELPQEKVITAKASSRN